MNSNPRGLPRWLNTALAGAALLVLAPLLAILSVAIKVSSPGPVLFRQQRVGRGGQKFTLLKLRTMRTGSGPLITQGGDKRITAIGRVLRRLKLDELPQLWNVVRGEMALVGPRPEVPQYVDEETHTWQEILSVRPGLTDPASLELRNEERLLATVDDPEGHYRKVLLPHKLELSAAYLRNRTAWSDAMMLVNTARALFGPAGRERDRPPGKAGETVPRGDDESA